MRKKKEHPVMDENSRKEYGRLTVGVTSKQVYRRALMMRVTKLIILIMILLLSILYGIIYIVNSTGNFTITLDPHLKASKNIVVSRYRDFRETALVLKAEALPYMDNITESWLPHDLDEQEGPHSGGNYLAYTFWVKNDGEETVSYRTVIDVLSVIKGVDNAVRVAVYANGEKTVYAKKSPVTGEAEPNTVAFVSDHQVMNRLRENFEPGNVDRYTVVVWLEGEDPECIDNIIGGEMKMEMSIGEDK